MSGIEVEHLPAAGAAWIEDTKPVFVVPSRSADESLHFTKLSFTSQPQGRVSGAFVGATDMPVQKIGKIIDQ